PGTLPMTAEALVPSSFSWKRFLAVAGPGIVVMLADTDAGSVITAAQSGAQWGYSLLLLQIVLIPILYIVQELTVRLGAVTGKGHAALIKQHFGLGWAWLSVATLIVTCLGALLTEFAGLAGAGRRGNAGDGAHARVRDRRADCDRGRRVRTGLSPGRDARPSGTGRDGVGRGDDSCDGPKIPPAGLGQHRRGDHALDGLLPAVVDR